MLSLKKLERIYQDILGSKDKDFYLEIKKYISYIISQRKSKRSIKKIIGSSQEDSRKYRENSRKLKDKLLKIKKEIENKKIQNDSVKKLLEEFDGYISGKIKSSAPLTESLFYNLGDILNQLNKKYDEETLDLIKKYWEEKEKFENKREISVWNSYFELSHLKDALETDLSKLNFWEKMNIGLLKNELSKVIRGDEKLEKKKREDYERHLKRIHNFISEKRIKINWKFVGWAIMFILALISLGIYLNNVF